MKYLVLVRHATAEIEPVHKDFERRLSPQGEKEAQQTGSTLQDLWKAHQLGVPILKVSPAQRTLDTARALWKPFTGTSLTDDFLDKNNQLYRGELDDWLDAVRSTVESAHALILIGHNPGISFFASEIAKANFNFSPGRFLILRATTTWKETYGAPWDIFASSL